MNRSICFMRTAEFNLTKVFNARWYFLSELGSHLRLMLYSNVIQRSCVSSFQKLNFRG